MINPDLQKELKRAYDLLQEAYHELTPARDQSMHHYLFMLGTTKAQMRRALDVLQYVIGKFDAEAKEAEARHFERVKKQYQPDESN